MGISIPDALNKLDLESHFSRFCSFSAGETILHENDESNEIYFILNGAVKVSNYSASGREVWHTELEAGTFFGEIAAFLDKPRSGTIVATQDTKLAVISKSELHALIRLDPDISIWIITELARRIEQTTQRFTATISQRVAQRVRARLLQIAQEQSEPDAEALIIQPIPNFSKLAVQLNTDRENVSREVSALTKSGAIERGENYLRIVQPERFLADT